MLSIPVPYENVCPDTFNQNTTTNILPDPDGVGQPHVGDTVADVGKTVQQHHSVHQS